MERNADVAEIVLKPLTKTQFEQAFLLASEVFVTDSSLHKALGVERDAYRNYLRPSFFKMLEEDLSVGAFDQNNNALLGVLIAGDFYKSITPIRPHKAAPIAPQFQPIAALSEALGAIYWEQRPITPGETVLVDMAAVHPAARGRGLYRKLRTFFADYAGQRGYRHVVGELSSSATQKVVLDDLGHRSCTAIEFANFTYDSHFPFRSITEPTHIILAEGRLPTPS